MTQFFDFHLTTAIRGAIVTAMTTSNINQTVEDHVNQFVLEYMLYLHSFEDEYPVVGVSSQNSHCCDTLYLENDSLPLYIQGPDSRQLSSTPLVALLQYLAERPFIRFTLPTFYQLLTTVYGSPVTETPFNRLLHASAVALDIADSVDSAGAVFTLAPRVMDFVRNLPKSKDMETLNLLEENFSIPSPVPQGPASNSYFIYWELVRQLTTDTARRFLKVLHFSQEGRRSPIGILALHRHEFNSHEDLLSTLREMNERTLIQWPKEGEKESMEARIEEFEPVFATIEPKK
jgi:hypothetical protein